MSNKISHKISVTLSSSNEKKTLGTAWIEEWTQRQRLKRALKALGISWGLGTIAVFIPGMHFILVPGLLIAGPFLAYNTYQIRNIISGGTGTCPQCGKSFSIVKAPLKWPLNDLCSACLIAVTVHPADSHEI